MPNLDMKFQVFIHGVNVVEYILDDPGNDAHALRIVQVPLQSHKHTLTRNDDVR